MAHPTLDEFITYNVLEDVMGERKSQQAKWGQADHSAPFWYALIGEEVGEVARGFLERDMPNYREELIQVAALCVAAVEAYDRGTTSPR